MARTRSIRRSPNSRTKKKSKSPTLPFLPETWQAFCARRLIDIVALTLTLGGIFIACSLFSYNPADPSFNTATDVSANTEIKNWMGTYGALGSDLIIQTLGLAGFIIAMTIGAWGLRIFNRQNISPLWLRTITLITATLFGAIALAQIPSGTWAPHPYAGGSFGTLILENIANATQNISPFLNHATIAIIAGLIALPAMAFTICMTRSELAFIGQSIVFAIKSLSLLILNTIIGFKNWINHYNDDGYKPEPFAAVKNAFANAPRIAPTLSFGNNQDETESPTTIRATRPQTQPQEQPIQATPKANTTIPVVTPAPGKAIKKQPNTNQQKFNLAEGEEWEFPPLDLLETPPANIQTTQLNESALRKNAELLQNVLADFNVEGEITSIHPGPVVTLYELEPAPGTKSAKVISLADDIARSMSAVSVRVAVVPGRNVIGIELPNKTRQIVYMQELLASQMFEKTKAHLPLVLGKDIGGQPILADLAKMPHLLVAGTTGSGKSVAVNTMILSLLYALSPEQCRFIMIDPKMLELSVYDDIPHLLSPVVTEPGKAVVALKWTVNEMESRYRAMSKLGVRNIEGYNARMREAKAKGETIMNKVQTGFDVDTGEPTFEDREMNLEELPYIVVVVDEFADLMLVAGKDVESAIQRLAQMARAAGIHLIMATQRPSVDVITGVIKANFPTRISFQVTSKVDSRTILGEGGAEQLLGMGDMLYMAPGGRITRVHGPFVSDGDVEKVVDDLKAKAAPAYVDSVTDEDGIEGGEVMNAMFGGRSNGGSDVDELYDQAVAIVAREGRASTSFIQRCLQIGYNRAARIIEEMESQGVVSKANATGKREVLIRDFSDV